MHKSILLAPAFTFFATMLAKKFYDALGIDCRSRPSLATGSARPSLELRRNGPGYRNRIEFTPAPAFLFIVGPLTTIAIASATVDHLRSAGLRQIHPIRVLVDCRSSLQR